MTVLVSQTLWKNAGITAGGTGAGGAKGAPAIGPADVHAKVSKAERGNR